MTDPLDKALRRGWFFGSDEFRDGLLDRIKKSDRKGREVARLHDEREAERIIEFGLGMWGLRKADLKTMPKGKPEKIAMACLVRKRTVMTNGWKAAKPMGVRRHFLTVDLREACG